MNQKIITILGATAVGKTALAVQVANRLGGEIISADSRQVFRGMDIGTGKDLSNYTIDHNPIPYHLIDIVDAGTEYSLFNFVSDFKVALKKNQSQDKWAILCGGTGLYMDAVLRGYDLHEVPKNKKLREHLSTHTQAELFETLSTFRQLHNTTDSFDRERTIRAIEIEIFKQQEQAPPLQFNLLETPVFGLYFNREIIRTRISQRLKDRLEGGMIDEVQNLLNLGIPASRLLMYGLEYKFVTRYLQHELAYNEMSQLLETAIHQFAKRQMTWFRRMEKNGVKINWMNGDMGIEKNLETVIDYLSINQ